MRTPLGRGRPVFYNNSFLRSGRSSRGFLGCRVEPLNMAGLAMDNNTTTVQPKLKKTSRLNDTRVIRDRTSLRTVAGKAYRTKIESLLDKSEDVQLADVWQRVCPLQIDPAHELADRRGLVEDLADFAEVLRPNLDGMRPARLRRLIETYAAYELRRSASHSASPRRAAVRRRRPASHASALARGSSVCVTVAD